MKVAFTAKAWEDYLSWQQTDRQVLGKINELIKECKRNPYSGLGKPERLKGDLSGYFSRRINEEHRLVYAVVPDEIIIIQCRYHYGK